MKKYLREFLNDTYPGAKRSPIDYVKLLSMPDIKPDMAIKGIVPLSQSCKVDNGLLNYMIMIISTLSFLEISSIGYFEFS